MMNPYMKLQTKTYYAQFKTYAMHQKVCNVKNAQLQRAITHEEFFRISSKVNQVIYSSIPIYLLSFKALASIAFEIFC